MKFIRLIVVPDGMKSPQQIRISQKLIRWGLIALGFFVLLNFFIAGWNLWHIGSTVKMAVLQEQKTKLEAQVWDLRQRMDSLSTTLSSISQMNKTLYVSAGIPYPEQGYAVGGPQLAEISGNRFHEKMAFDFDSLLFVARQEAHALQSVQHELVKREKVLRHTPSVIPMKGYITSTFGKRLDPITRSWKMHEGIDICGMKGTPVCASADGTVRFAGWDHGFGKVVVIDHIWYETRYAHLDEISVVPGQKITRGDLVGKCGRTGRTTGTHLHYEVRVAQELVNPMDYILPVSICVD